MQQHIDIIPINSLVSLAGGTLDARVRSVSIGDGDAVRYEVAYWSGSTRTDVWVDAAEIEGFAGDRCRIGFKNHETER